MRAVIDTNVVFEGLTRKTGACKVIIEAWQSGLVQACVSNALAYEYQDVLSRKLSRKRWNLIEPKLDGLLSQVEFVTIYTSWRPASPDPGDDLVIDCAMSASAPIVTLNIKDFVGAMVSLGLVVMTPDEFVVKLIGSE